MAGGATGWLYGGTAVALGVGFLRAAHRLHAWARRSAGGSEPAIPSLAAMQVFHWAYAYLALLFFVLALNVLLASG